MMDTPICDFVRAYSESGILRLHMPGHKGVPVLGMEALDITEIRGADSLYEASGIIARSEQNASRLFGCPTYYSAEGSSQCIRAMLYLILRYAKLRGRRPLIAAGRNVHKTFLTAAALLDLEVRWLYPREQAGWLSCGLSPRELETWLEQAEEKPAAVYLTSPDYLGAMPDLRGIAEVCRRQDVLLAVDNAHGAYLRFLPESAHPMDLGADLCCDSAHKTLPVLTGGAYLHLSPRLEELGPDRVRDALALFGSTSPSYLILQSLDGANPYLERLPQLLAEFLPPVEGLKERLRSYGFRLYGNEPMKLTVEAKSFGYTGTGLAELLRERSIEPEFADPDHLVLMLSPQLGTDGLERLEGALRSIPRRDAILQKPPAFSAGERVLSIREAMLCESERLPAERCLGRIAAAPTVGCPPAVPLLICGERISGHMLDCFGYYGIGECCVVREA